MLTPAATMSIAHAANQLVAAVDAWLDRIYEVSTMEPAAPTKDTDALCDLCALVTNLAKPYPDDQATPQLLACMAELAKQYHDLAMAYPTPHVKG